MKQVGKVAEMNNTIITIFKLILWQGFEKPKKLSEILLSTISWIFSLIIIIFFVLLLYTVNTNLMLKFIIFAYLCPNILLLGCFFDGRAYNNNKILRFIHCPCIFLAIITNLFVTLRFLNNVNNLKNIDKKSPNL